MFEGPPFNERENLLKIKLGNLQVGVATKLDSEKLFTVPTSPVTAILKPVSTEKEKMLAYSSSLNTPDEDISLRLHGCMVVRDNGQGFLKLEHLEKEDSIAICFDVSTIYEKEYFLGVVTAEDPLGITKMYTLENPENQPEGLYIMTVNPPVITVPTQHLDFDFVKILLISNDGQELSLAAEINTVGTNHDIDMDENQLDGMMSRGVYNTSGGTIMWHVLHEFPSLTLGRETMQVMQQRDMLELKLDDLVYLGILSDPLREAIYIFMDMITETTIGSVQIKFYRASITVTQATRPE